jgi:hypothetical protein
MTFLEDILRIATLLRGARFNFTTEEELQCGVQRLLADAGFVANRDYVREHKLDARSRVDFYFPPSRVGLEAKINGSASAIARQVHRYLHHPDVQGLILLSRRANVESLPDAINEKPLKIVTLWSNGL